MLILCAKAILRKKAVVLKAPITVEDLKNTEKAILSHIQCKLETTQLKNLSPVEMSDGLLHVGGRLANAPISVESKFPIILPPHHVTKLIIWEIHQKSGHSGVERVLADSREKFWITKGRKTVKQVLSKCVPCKRSKQPLAKQRMADLPSDRVTPHEAPFTNVGVDYFGPIEVKRARSQIKRYGCLFTCLVTRAIHLEMAYSLETDSFINCLERFMARRGKPKVIR